MISCPACLSSVCVTLRTVNSSEAAQHFVLLQEDSRRHEGLRNRIEKLWGGEICEIAECCACGMGFAWPYVGGDEVFYNIAYPTGHYPKDRWEYGKTLDVVRYLKLEQVLEIGAGRGYFLDRLGLPSAAITAIEFNDVSRAAMRQKGYNAITVDIREFAADPFDAIFMFQVLEHLDHFDDVAAAINRLSKRDVFISVPNRRRIAFNESNGSLFDMPPNHIGRWTKRALEIAWGRHGFKVVAFEEEPVSMTAFIKEDVAYHLLRVAQRPRTLANRARSMAREFGRDVAQTAVIAAYGFTRVAVWMRAKKQKTALGGSCWLHLTKE